MAEAHKLCRGWWAMALRAACQRGRSLWQMGRLRNAPPHLTDVTEGGDWKRFISWNAPKTWLVFGIYPMYAPNRTHRYNMKEHERPP